jgi:hypothetical protein
MPIMQSILRRIDAKILPIPWDIIAPHERQALQNHGQDLATLRRRGGLGSCEAVAILEDRRWRKMDEIEAIERLGEIIRDATARLPGRPCNRGA